MTDRLSIVIVTKDRTLELSQCLGSLLSNDILPDEIIVVDNNSSDKTKQLIEGLSLQTKIKVRYLFFKGKGYPTIYNKGLKEARWDWVAFIDDDCIASRSWVMEIKNSIKRYPKTDVIMGWCGTYYSKNVFSQATLLFDNEWKERSLDGNKVTDFEVLDNKNIAYRKKFLEKKSLEFDEKRVKYQNGAAEDCDLGMQIQQAGGQAICNKKMMIWHKDPQDWLWFMKKNISSWQAYQSLSHKWDLSIRNKFKLEARPLPVLINKLGDELNLSFKERFKLFLVSKQVLFLNRILPFFYFTHKYFKVLNEK